MSRLIAIALTVLALAASCASKPQTSESLAQSDLVITDIQSAPVEYKLAYLDSGHLPRGTDVSAARIRFLLKTLSDKTGDTQQQIADRTSQSTSVLKDKYGRAVTHERFLEEAKAYFDSGGPKTGYNEVSTLLIMTMGK